MELAQTALEQEIKPNLPPGYFYSLSGQYEAEIEARSRLKIVVPLCIAMIFLLLYMKFRSLPAILSIFFAIPIAFVGGMWPNVAGSGCQVVVRCQVLAGESVKS